MVATPAPLAVSVDGELVALSVILNVVEVEPLLPGLKFTAAEILCPAARVLGRVRLLSVNSVFVVLAAEMVTGTDPALRVTVCVDVVPTVTLPKLKLVGDTVNVLDVGVLVVLALPDRATATLFAFCAATLNVPVKLPVVFGTNFS